MKDLREACVKMESELVEKHQHNACKSPDRVTEMAINACKNGAVGPLLLFIAWLDRNDSAQATLKALGYSWKP